ncbi:type VII secretion integral membrane protein EccD [Nocardia puris]|uniref:type VII secretion integral membrane protein EccD n=1 Tax=Nocardia puris TaxID=208602 RepID=UPI001895E2EC|nr:type VII secretion integral membrane protein EccD [Nocardia puris]MBF6212543.1 type VII secretion integral membrane protein EccD [Nocardia puris]MBF6366790.1 type VII secretion integral membrane protein EccD [Nocardia puris]
MTESSTGGVVAADPELCRVSVIGGNTQVDLGLPATVPIAAFITDVVELIESRNPDLTEHEEGAPLVTQHWTLARIGRDPIAPNQTLTEAEVYDGELLVLRPVAAKESPALFDDVIDAVSKLTTAGYRSWSPISATWMGQLAALVAALAATGLLLLAKADGAGWPIGFLPAGVGVAALVSAVIAIRRYQARTAAVLLSLHAMVLIFAAAVLFVPGSVGSPHLLLGSVAALVAAAVGYSVTGVGATMFAAVITTVLFTGVAAFVRMVWEFDFPKIAAGVVVASVIVIGSAARLAVAAARLPVPPVPTAGAAIDPADHEPRPTIEDIGAIGASALPSAAGLELRARAANEYQSGVIIGATAAGVVAAVVAADPLGSARWQGVTLAVIIALILCLRGRSFADLTQAATLIGGGVTTLFALPVAVALGRPESLVPCAAMVFALGAAAVAFGVIGPHTEMTPVTRRAGEIFEYLLIVAIVPLVLWIMGVYSAARNL